MTYFATKLATRLWRGSPNRPEEPLSNSPRWPLSLSRESEQRRPVEAEGGVQTVWSPTQNAGAGCAARDSRDRHIRNGSGKTEAFLLPVIAQLAREAVGWEAPEEDFLARRWWHDSNGKPYSDRDKKRRLRLKLPKDLRPDASHPLRTAFRRHRDGERRPVAVRALVLYPMNALVEDQIVRLRKALDSSEARQAMDEHFHGNRLFFGRYIGATPETGHRGSLESPRGLDVFLAGGKRAARGLGSVHFPGHKRADKNGDVAYEDVWQDELDRRRRRLDRLFEHMVGFERGQQQARLYALDAQAQADHQRSIREWEHKHGKTASKDVYLDLAQRAGKRTLSGALKDYGKRFGVPDDETRRLFAQQPLTDADASAPPSATAINESPFMYPSVDGSELTNRWTCRPIPGYSDHQRQHAERNAQQRSRVFDLRENEEMART